MGFYNDLVSAGNTGLHMFDANLIDPALLSGATISNVRVHRDGELVDVTAGGNFSLPNVLIHRRGRIGARNLNLDVIVLTTAQLAALSNQRQAYVYELERVPDGVNPLNPGRRVGASTRPKRIESF